MISTLTAPHPAPPLPACGETSAGGGFPDSQATGVRVACRRHTRRGRGREA